MTVDFPCEMLKNLMNRQVLSLLSEQTHLRQFSTSRVQLIRQGDRVSLVKRIIPRDIVFYSDLVNDHNPIHQPHHQPSIVHGTYLLGLVSGLMSSTLPGPGTVLTQLSVRFSAPCQYPSTVLVSVELGRVRRLTSATFQVEDSETGDLYLSGEVKCLLTSEQLSNRE